MRCGRTAIMATARDTVIPRPVTEAMEQTTKTMRKIQTLMIVAAVALFLGACSTTQKTWQISKGSGVPVHAVDTIRVTPIADVLSIKELVGVFANESDADAAMSKYGYKVKKGYEVFRVDKYDKMYYKNCRLAKIITDGKYDDYPRALKAGISSFVAVKGESMMLGVFNNNAYQNLVDQVKMNGFKLDMEGNEDIYTNGKYYIACNKNNRTVRIQKV